uniref:Uncharacterized protein n=1 Tax=Romanomermis culicivorax TaxID=13658 RepID=A0A915HID1_ROMCU
TPQNALFGPDGRLFLPHLSKERNCANVEKTGYSFDSYMHIRSRSHLAPKVKILQDRPTEISTSQN